MSEELSTSELIAQAEASGNPERIAAAAKLRALQAEFKAEGNLKAAKTALADAERSHAGKLVDLRSAVSDAEAYAAPRVKEAQDTIAKATAGVTAAKAALAAAEVDPEHRAKIASLREGVAKAQAVADAARVK